MKNKTRKISDEELFNCLQWSSNADESNELAKLYLEACGLIGRISSPQLKMVVSDFWPDKNNKNSGLNAIKMAIDIDKTRIEYRDRLARIIIAHIKSNKDKK